MRTAWLLLCLPHAALAAPWLRNEGVATSAQGDLLYREVHWRRGPSEGAERWVLYQCPDGRPFARKHLPASARRRPGVIRCRTAVAGKPLKSTPVANRCPSPGKKMPPASCVSVGLSWRRMR